MKRQSMYAGILILLMAVLVSGCAYYNTFYNAKKKFNEAERDNRKPQTSQTTPARPAQSTTTQTAAPQRNVLSPEKYRKVIETCSKLLEFYPKSRWVDDALYLMGVSYYRLGELSRAERKFAELQTLFPKSRYIPAATLFLGRTYIEQKDFERAIDLISKGLPAARTNRDKADMHYLLGVIYRDQRRWSDAAEQFQTTIELQPSRELLLKTYYEYGLAEYNAGKYEAARDALARVARLTSDWSQAYDAFIYWSRSEARLQNYEMAEGILRRIGSSPKYLEHTEDIPLELAEIALEAEHTDNAVMLYQEYVYKYPQGTRRSFAYYRLALIHRDKLIDLPNAKAYLDSAVASGGTLGYADSARTALAQLSKGLLAIDRIEEINAQLAGLNESANSAAPALVTEDSVTQQSPVVEEIEDEKPDSMESQSRVRKSPAATLADSIARALQRSDSLAADSLKRIHTDTLGTNPDIIEPGEDLADAPDEEVVPSMNQEQTLRRELHQAYLHVAEFYQYGLADTDSALHYYRLAASLRDDPSTYWKANLFLAEHLARNDTLSSAKADAHYRAVVEADSVPLEASNLAREALHLPLIERPIPPQRIALQNAEEVQLAGHCSPDSLLALYSQVIAFDSSSPEGQTALFAKAHIYENDLAEYDSAGLVFSALLEYFPDSSFARRLRRKLGPPDSLASSYFTMTKDEIIGKRAPLEDFLEQSPDSSGWPPPEESLEGRRYQ